MTIYNICYIIYLENKKERLLKMNEDEEVKYPKANDVKKFLKTQGINPKSLSVSCGFDKFQMFEINVIIKDSSITDDEIRCLIIDEFGYYPLIGYDDSVERENVVNLSNGWTISVGGE